MFLMSGGYLRKQGAFEKGLKHGYGTYYYPDGRSFVGNYEVHNMR